MYITAYYGGLNENGPIDSYRERHYWRRDLAGVGVALLEEVRELGQDFEVSEVSDAQAKPIVSFSSCQSRCRTLGLLPCFSS